jgi:SAM-dependent methyltransferase
MSSSVDNKTPLQAWLQTAAGKYLYAQEMALYDAAVSEVFGFYAAQVGMLQMDLLKNVRIPKKFKLDAMAGDVRCASHQLPFASNSLDLIQLPHGLDFSTEPQQALREVERVLVAEGHVMLSGFNPWSLWGAKRLFNRRSFPWDSQFLPLLRVKDWLSLLGFDLVSVRMACYGPACSSERWAQRCAWMDSLGSRWYPMMGGIYFIVAKKKVLGMRVIRPNWKRPRLRTRFVTSTQKGGMHSHRASIKK